MARYLTPTLATNTATGTSHERICIEGFTRGHLYAAAAIGSATAVAFLTAPTKDADLQQLYDEDNNLVSITLTTATNYPLPAEIFGANYLQVVSSGAAWSIILGFDDN